MGISTDLISTSCRPPLKSVTAEGRPSCGSEAGVVHGMCPHARGLRRAERFDRPPGWGIRGRVEPNQPASPDPGKPGESGKTGDSGDGAEHESILLPGAAPPPAESAPRAESPSIVRRLLRTLIGNP